MTSQLIPAFLVGGLICALGQVIMDMASPRFKPGHVLVGYVVAGAIASVCGIYQHLIDLGGAGATVPLSGFGHLLAQGALEAVNNKGIIGAMTGGVEAGAGGIAAAVAFGYLMAILFNPKG